MEKAKLRTIFAAFTIMVLGLGASYASMMPQKEKENLVIAGKLGPEPDSHEYVQASH